MRDLLILFVHLIVTVIRLARPGGIRAVVAESVLIKHHLIVNRSRQRAPNLRPLDRLIAGFCSLWIKRDRLLRAAIVLKPSTLLHFHRALVQRKYRLLFSPKRRAKPGPKGPEADLIRTVVDMKQRNPTWGCPRIAQQITLTFGIPVNKDMVRQILALHYRPVPDSGGLAERINRLGDLIRTTRMERNLYIKDVSAQIGATKTMILPMGNVTVCPDSSSKAPDSSHRRCHILLACKTPA